MVIKFSQTDIDSCGAREIEESLKLLAGEEPEFRNQSDDHFIPRLQRNGFRLLGSLKPALSDFLHQLSHPSSISP